MRMPLAKPSESLHYRVVGAEGGNQLRLTDALRFDYTELR